MASAKVIVHEIHCLNEVAMEGDEHRIIAWECVKRVEMMSICYFVVPQRAVRAFDHVVETKIRTRGEVRWQDAIIPAGYEDSGYAMQLA